MDRRRFITLSTSFVGLLGVSAVAGWQWIPQNPDDLSIPGLIAALQPLDANHLSFDSSWSTGHILSHLAQSIECSMLAYPLHKPEWFKDSVGKVAFQAFSAKGYMRHNLEEDIPGIKHVDETQLEHVTPEVGKARLLAALYEFQQYDGPLAEHFAYGTLSHADYARAHVLHVNDHWRMLKSAHIG